jgi:hypothetical protein
LNLGHDRKSRAIVDNGNNGRVCARPWKPKRRSIFELSQIERYPDGGGSSAPNATIQTIDLLRVIIKLVKPGRVAWVRVEMNYRERPSNQQLRAALDALK